MNKKTLKSRLLASSIVAGGLAVAAAPGAVAQEDDTEARQETVVVTGSRIAKQDFVSNSPVSTVGAEQFELTGTVNTESLLNTLPQTVPGLDRTSNNPGGGFATVDLRGLGAGRTLVLIDGRRVVPTTGGGVVDINNIPTALIERVEVLTGGASAVYGADAVAGVVNFILKDDFEGAEFNAGWEGTIEQGDAQIWSASATVGGNFANDRGNAVVSLGYASREALFQGDRDFSTFAQFDDGEGGLFDGGSSGVPQGAIFGAFSGASGFGPGIFNEDGTIRPFVTAGDDNDFYNYAPVNFLQLPQERIQLNAQADFDITDRVNVYVDGFFANNEVPQQLAPTPIFEPRTTTEQVSLDGNPFIDPTAQQIISDAIGSGVDTDGDGIDDTFDIGAFGIRRRLEEVGPRISNDEFTSFQVTAGINFDITDSWNADIYFQEGRTKNSSTQEGNVNVDRFFQALNLADADGDGNVDVDAFGNPTCADDNSNGSFVPCAPLNIFGQGNISPESADFIRTLVNSEADYTVTNLVANLVGDTSGLFELPGGPIGLAFGAEYREEDFVFRPSQDLAASTIAGFNGSPPIPESSFDVYGIYGEAYVPILKDAPFADILALELAYRDENYSVRGLSSNGFDTEAWKIAGEWAPIEDIRFRASFNTTVRSPSITELFAPQGENFPGASDPCASGFDGTATTQALCEALGVPAANVGSANIDLPSGQVREISGGNPELEPETGETLTLGFVAQPRFIDGLSVSVDYFDIQIEEAITAFGGGANNVISTCFGDADLGGVGSPFCNAITRGGSGLITSVSVASQNVALATLKGIDFQASYSHDLGGVGIVGFDYVGTYTDESDTIPFEGGGAITCAGEFGADCGEPLPHYGHRLVGKWANGPFNAQATWRYIGATDDDGGLGITLAVPELDAESYFDISGAWDVNDNLTFTAGIDNLLDTEPPILGDNQEQANTFPATYDVFGRTLFLNARVKF